MNDTAANYSPIVVSEESTVVAEYVADANTSTAYQSEAQLEDEFIAALTAQAYEHLPITSEDELIANLRTQLEALNQVTFSDDEWTRFFNQAIAPANEGVVDKAEKIQTNHKLQLIRDDGSSKNIDLIDKTHIHNNRLQVINQYEVAAGEGGATHASRYDVTVLVNGLPMVHIELKRRGVALKEAFNQIRRYDRDSFWAGSGLFNYVQLFVISNGTHTKYYSNTTRHHHVRAADGSTSPTKTKASNTFEFTTWWADARNQPIQDLTGFAKTFFARHTLLNILTKYCVFNTDRDLMVMRPYQIVATERILQRIVTSTNLKQLGTVAAGGYVWHTTGSGKTLTSFKTAQLATQLDGVDKVLFVVDRKDLDYQTMREYNRFQEGAANSNRSTKVLAQQLGDPAAKIIITTIQKLANYIKSYGDRAVYDGRMVMIFDECHRSQFGDMHRSITKAFKNYNLFGFTGTPIFTDNAPSSGSPKLKTTQQAFGDCLHTYTIVDAITDKNVLPFRVDYINTIKPGVIDDAMVAGIDTEEVLNAPERRAMVVDYILTHFDRKTRRSKSYEHTVVTNVGEVVRSKQRAGEQSHKVRSRGFNALFATSSIDAAFRYYNDFRVAQMDVPVAQRLKVGVIFSYAPNADEVGGLLDEEGFDTSHLPSNHRDQLEDAINDYNDMFGTSYEVAGDSFQDYYKDLSLRMKNREIDLVIVVNMFLTGFDSKTLNTLFVDKNLRSHGLIQAYSRTNRILNSVKTYGNIVCFRDLEQATNDAIALFGDADAGGVVILAPYQEYYVKFTKLVAELSARFPLGEPIIGEDNQKAFVGLWGAILRSLNVLTSFDEFIGDTTLSEADRQNYDGIYNDIRDAFRTLADGDQESILDDVVFEIELVTQVEVNVDYILMLVEQHRHDGGDDIEVKAEIARNVNASPSLRNKRDLIEDFIDRVTVNGSVTDQWDAYIAERRRVELDAIIAEEDLQPDGTRDFMATSFRNGYVSTTGTAINKVLKPVSKFAPDSNHAAKKARVLDKLTAYHDRFADLSTPTPDD